MRHDRARLGGRKLQRMLLTPSFPTDDEGNSSTRPLGLLVARGTLLTSISPSDGSEVIDNPFAADAEEEVTLEG